MLRLSEVRLPGVAGGTGCRGARAERGHARTVVTGLGEVVVRRIAYRSGIRGAGSLFPRDAVLNLPPCGFLAAAAAGGDVLPGRVV